jgi:HTH-type transcriptional regulator, glycine betaine synthesis regulator
MGADERGPAVAEFVEGMGAVTEFWGAGRHTGRLWAVLYLTPEPMSLDALAAAVGITKGHASTNLRTLLRLRMVRRFRRPADRRDWFEAEADIWSVAKGVLRERGVQEFDEALASSDRALRLLELARDALPAQRHRFLRQRIQAVRDFNASLDRAVDALLKFEDLRGAVARLIGREGGRST